MANSLLRDMVAVAHTLREADDLENSLSEEDAQVLVAQLIDSMHAVLRCEDAVVRTCSLGELEHVLVAAQKPRAEGKRSTCVRAAILVLQSPSIPVSIVHGLLQGKAMEANASFRVLRELFAVWIRFGLASAQCPYDEPVWLRTALLPVSENGNPDELRPIRLHLQVKLADSVLHAVRNAEKQFNKNAVFEVEEPYSGSTRIETRCSAEGTAASSYRGASAHAPPVSKVLHMVATETLTPSDDALARVLWRVQGWRRAGLRTRALLASLLAAAFEREPADPALLATFLEIIRKQIELEMDEIRMGDVLPDSCASDRFDAIAVIFRFAERSLVHVRELAREVADERVRQRIASVHLTLLNYPEYAPRALAESLQLLAAFPAGFMPRCDADRSMGAAARTGWLLAAKCVSLVCSESTRCPTVFTRSCSSHTSSRQQRAMHSDGEDEVAHSVGVLLSAVLDVHAQSLDEVTLSAAIVGAFLDDDDDLGHALGLFSSLSLTLLPLLQTESNTELTAAQQLIYQACRAPDGVRMIRALHPCVLFPSFLACIGYDANLVIDMLLSNDHMFLEALLEFAVNLERNPRFFVASMLSVERPSKRRRTETAADSTSDADGDAADDDRSASGRWSPAGGDSDARESEERRQQHGDRGSAAAEGYGTNDVASEESHELDESDSSSSASSDAEEAVYRTLTCLSAICSRLTSLQRRGLFPFNVTPLAQHIATAHRAVVAYVS